MERADFRRKHKIFAERASGSVLDIGFAQEPNPYLKNPVGIDIQDVPKPANYKSVHVCNLNAQRLPFKDGTFDTVVMGDTIEHLENPTSALIEINRVLKKNGKLLISTPNAAYYWNLIDDWLFLHLVKDPDPGEHLSDWTRRDFIRLLRKNGFRVRKMYGGGGMLPLLRLRYPNKRFPLLGWIVIYEAVKEGAPNRNVFATPNEKETGSVELTQRRV